MPDVRHLLQFELGRVSGLGDQAPRIKTCTFDTAELPADALGAFGLQEQNSENLGPDIGTATDSRDVSWMRYEETQALADIGECSEPPCPPIWFDVDDRIAGHCLGKLQKASEDDTFTYLAPTTTESCSGVPRGRVGSFAAEDLWLLARYFPNVDRLSDTQHVLDVLVARLRTMRRGWWRR
ncbi:hypothetical protein FIV42_10535 [Persicimonas caeni]|uniref:Uncharacterized protein n=1 Tax=Persicimonas caeni TaxID=2292766 RepID=A0A4Y6PT05_PERCE|nr:hypothetical protein [Persicimonas caeni]QDG51157.1 hypothetical protein FIV42_10535 [Persicimonas caeni]QED32378.1 hypothetical protein FRD00_10530 [Persicimonas caeni]